MATFSVLRSLALNSSKQGALNFSTSTCLCKRQSPRTVGVMGWFKAARRRLDHERKMKEKPKTPVQLEAEVRLQQQEGIEFLTTNRVKYRMSEDGNKLAIKPEVMLSKDRQTVICYHPPPKQFPFHFTAAAEAGARWQGIATDDYEETLSEEQIIEVKMLRIEDPKLWTVRSLANMMQVKPDVIRPHARLDEKLQEAVKVQRQLYNAMVLSERKKIRQRELWERVQYVKDTRGDAQAQAFSARERQSGADRQYVPPKRTPWKHISNNPNIPDIRKYPGTDGKH